MIRNYFIDGIEYSTFYRKGKEFTRKLIRNGTHKKSNSRIYSIWKGMKSRCLNPNNKKYKFYGGKNIKIFSEWIDKNGFNNFYNWSINNGYKDNLSLDRKNPNEDYSPENCQWISLIDNIKKDASKKHFPKYRYTALNVQENIEVVFYSIKDFQKQFDFPNQRVCDCCLGKIKEYKGWSISREKITVQERQETILKKSTVEVEFPLEVRNIH